MLTPDDDKTRTHVTLTCGTMVSHYRIIENIGARGMGEVYLAEDTELNRKIALKFLPPHLCQDADCRARFKREAQAAAILSKEPVPPVQYNALRWTARIYGTLFVVVLLSLTSIEYIEERRNFSYKFHY